MDGLCSGDLTSITGGRLNLGTLPPLGGVWEPVTNIVTDSRMICRGDVFWDLLTSPSSPGSSAEEAFARGALGVVSSRRALEPWGGAFVIEVRDSRQALLDLGRWARRRHLGRVIAVTSWRPSPLSRILQLLFGFETPADDGTSFRTARSEHNCHCGSALSVNRPPSTGLASVNELALHLVRQASSSLTTVIPFDSKKIHDSLAISDLCCPHVAVINSSPCGDQANSAELTESWLASLPNGGLAVLTGLMAERPNGWEAGAREADHGVQVVRVGTTDRCDLRIERVQRQGEMTLLKTNHGRLMWKLRPAWPVTEIMAAYVTSQWMGVRQNEFAEACETLSQPSLDASVESPVMMTMEESPLHSLKYRSEKSKVPPLVSGLRESDTALPPGLKRFAC